MRGRISRTGALAATLVALTAVWPVGVPVVAGQPAASIGVEWTDVPDALVVAVSPDGEWLSGFAASRPCIWHRATLAETCGDIEGNWARRTVSWSPDSDAFAFAETSWGNRVNDVLVMDQHGDLRCLTCHIKSRSWWYSPVWSADGGLIVAAAGEIWTPSAPGTVEIRGIDVATGDVNPVAALPDALPLLEGPLWWDATGGLHLIYLVRGQRTTRVTTVDVDRGMAAAVADVDYYAVSFDRPEFTSIDPAGTTALITDRWDDGPWFVGGVSAQRIDLSTGERTFALWYDVATTALIPEPSSAMRKVRAGEVMYPEGGQAFSPSGALLFSPFFGDVGEGTYLGVVSETATGEVLATTELLGADESLAGTPSWIGEDRIVVVTDAGRVAILTITDATG